MRFTDILPSAGGQAAAPQQQYAAAQPYPGDPALAPANVDTTYTGSVNRAAVRPATSGGQRFWQRAFRAPVPSVDVGGQAATAAAPLPPQPAPQSFPVAAQPFPTAPAGTVTRGPAPDPVYRQASLPAAQPAPLAPADVDTTYTGSIAPAAPAAPAPAVIGPGETAVTARAGDTLRKISDRYGVSVDRLASANGLSANAALTPGQTVIIPRFGSSASTTASAPPAPPAAAPVQQAALPVEPAVPANAPVPTRKPADRVAVVPQPARVAERPQQPAATGNTAPSTGSVYVVRSGDTLSAIAGRHGTTAAAIRQANGMDSGIIRVGQKLVVPGAGAAGSSRVAAAAVPAGVDPIVTGSTAKAAPVAGYTPPKKPDIAMEDAVRQTAAAPGATGIGSMRWPVRGKVVSGFGDTRGARKNDGIDIAVPEGTSVKAAENGVVIYAGDGLKDFGNTVLVRHENGLVTVYGHASEIKVARGETVRRGQEIARSGVSGNADTPKLHFEVRKDSAPVDPASFLE